jgi:hypothetical protein
MQLHRLHSSSRVRFAITLMAAMVLGATGLMAATTYYVSPLGDDLNNDGKSEGQAFKTPAKALAVASTSDEIVVLTGDYQLTAELAISKAVTLRGVDRNSVILRAAAGKRAVFISVAGAVLSTVTVTDGSGDYKGANVYMTVASTVTNCVLRNGFSNNNGNGGAGIWLEAGLVTDTVITNNGIGATSNSHTGGARGQPSPNAASSRSTRPSAAVTPWPAPPACWSTVPPRSSVTAPSWKTSARRSAASASRHRAS